MSRVVTSTRKRGVWWVSRRRQLVDLSLEERADTKLPIRLAAQRRTVPSSVPSTNGATYARLLDRVRQRPLTSLALLEKGGEVRVAQEVQD